MNRGALRQGTCLITYKVSCFDRHDIWANECNGAISGNERHSVIFLTFRLIVFSERLMIYNCVSLPSHLNVSVVNLPVNYSTSILSTLAYEDYLTFTIKQNDIKKKIITQVVLSVLCRPYFLIPRGLSPLYRCSLTTMAEDIPFHEIPLMAHNWQKWKSTFLTGTCHKIYRIEAVGLKRSNCTLKITIFVNICNLGQFRENLIFC